MHRPLYIGVHRCVSVYSVIYAGEDMHGYAQVYSDVVQVCVHVGICTCPYRSVESRHVQVCSVTLLWPHTLVRCHLRLAHS